jgi:hypothetical protein
MIVIGILWIVFNPMKNIIELGSIIVGVGIDQRLVIIQEDFPGKEEFRDSIIASRHLISNMKTQEPPGVYMVDITMAKEPVSPSFIKHSIIITNPKKLHLSFEAEPLSFSMN